MRSTECDLICVASCTQLIKENIINIPKFGVINSHSSLLPQYRGSNPTYWIFCYNMEKRGGNTIHYIDVGEDTGEILLQRGFDIPFEMSYKEYNEILTENGSSLMVEALKQIEAGTAHPQKQIDTIPLRKGRRCTPEDFQIDWKSWDCRRAYHFIRGVDYWSNVKPNSCWNYSAIGISEKEPDLKNYILCSDGYVVLSKKLSVKQCIKNLLGFFASVFL